MTKIIFATIMNLVTPKAGAKHELLFNEPAIGFLNLIMYKNIIKIIITSKRAFGD
jgi:hypothetical protein